MSQVLNNFKNDLADIIDKYKEQIDMIDIAYIFSIVVTMVLKEMVK